MKIKDAIAELVSRGWQEGDGNTVTYRDGVTDEPSLEVIAFAKKTLTDLRQKFPGLRFTPEVIDEWVNIEISEK